MAAECLLNDPEISIVTENDHKVGTCLCRLCTCGVHICPRAAVPRSHSFATCYRKDYKKHHVKSVERRSPFLPFVRSKAAMELKSSMKRDYVAPATQSQQELPRAHSSSPKLSFIGNSSYCRDFPDWGPSHPSRERHPVARAHLQELHFVARSTYQRHFLGSPATDHHHCSPIKHRNVVGLSELSYTGESTSKRMHQLQSVYMQLNPRVTMKPEEYTRLATPSCHHRTTHNSTFCRVAVNPKDPSVLRRRRAQYSPV